MPLQNKFISWKAIKESQNGDTSRAFKEAESVITSNAGFKDSSQAIFSAIDKACVSSNFRNRFLKQLVQEKVLTPEKAKEVRVYTEEEKLQLAYSYDAALGNGSVKNHKDIRSQKEKEILNSDDTTEEKLQKFSELNKQTAHFAVDADNYIETNILPLLEGLTRNDDLTSRITVIQDTQFKQLIEFDAEKDASNLATASAGTDQDEVTRAGLALNNNNRKIQASTKIHERSLANLSPEEWAQFVARLVNRISYGWQRNILYADDTNNQFQRGFLNNVGNDASTRIGAIDITALVQANTNSIVDKLLTMNKDLPRDLSQVEEDGYVYIANRVFRETLRMTKDANQNYYFPNAMSGSNNFVIAGHDLVTSSAANDGDVFLVRPTNYVCIVHGNGSILTDDGVVELREGYISYVARVYADGSPTMAFKQKATTTGTTIDNQARNYHRYALIN